MKAERFRQAPPKTGRPTVTISRWKHFLTVFLSLIAVAAAALLPPALSRVRDQFSLPGVHLESAVPVTLEPDAALCLKEKLALICRMRQESSRMITSARELSKDEAAAVWESAKPELELMIKCGAFPAEYDFSLSAATQLTLVVYTDTEDLSQSVSIWNLSLAAPEGASDHYLSLSLDAETGRILEYSFTLPYDSSISIDSDEDAPYLLPLWENTAKGFGEYLGIDCQLNAASSSCPLEFSSKDKKIRYALYGDGVTDMRIILF